MSSQLAKQIATRISVDDPKMFEAVDEELAATLERFRDVTTSAHLEHAGLYERLDIYECPTDRCKRSVEVLKQLEPRGGKR